MRNEYSAFAADFYINQRLNLNASFRRAGFSQTCLSSSRNTSWTVREIEGHRQEAKGDDHEERAIGFQR